MFITTQLKIAMHHILAMGKKHSGTNTYPVNYRGEYYYRSGSTKQLLKGQALNQFLLKKTGITWDSVPIQNIEIRDLMNDSFDIFSDQAVKSKRMDEPNIKVSNGQFCVQRSR